MKTPFCEVYVARGFCRLKPLETRPNVCLTIITPNMIFTKMEPNVLKKLLNYNHLDTTNLFKPRLTVHVAFLRRHINSRMKALNRQDFFNTGFTMAC